MTRPNSLWNARQGRAAFGMFYSALQGIPVCDASNTLAEVSSAFPWGQWDEDRVERLAIRARDEEEEE